jgi:hypothetical protein
MNYQHQNLAAGGWNKLSLAEQLGNIGSETNRALNWRGKNEENFENAIWRALELIDLTIADSRWKRRLKEIVRLREVLCDTVFGDKEYGDNLKGINNYLFNFAVLARSR